MKIFVGETVRKAVENPKQGVSKSKLAKAIERSRTRLYELLNNPEMEASYVLKIGKVIGYDFSQDFPELRELTGETLSEAQKMESEKLKDELIDLQRKYNRALEDIRNLQAELLDIHKKKVVSEHRLATTN